MRNYLNVKEILRSSNIVDWLVAFIILICLLIAWIFVVAPRILLRH